MYKKLFLAVFCMVALSGCAGMKWTHPTKNEQQFHADNFDCEQRAASIYPTAIVQSQTSAGYVGTSSTTCNRIGTQLNCTSTPATYTPPTTMSYDANGMARTNAIGTCLRSLGYIRASEIPSSASNTGDARLSLISEELKPEHNPTLRVCNYGKMQRVVKAAEACSPTWP